VANFHENHKVDLIKKTTHPLVKTAEPIFIEFQCKITRRNYGKKLQQQTTK